MIKCEMLEDGIVSIEIRGQAGDVNAEFCYILTEWAVQMEKSTTARRDVHIWNACMIALGEDMTELDIFDVGMATNENRFYAPKRGDGFPLDLWHTLEKVGN